jgi:hypothetical protein
MENSPYRSPGMSTEEMPSDLIESMRNTKGWVAFLAVLGFIGCGVIALGGLIFSVGLIGARTGFPAAMGLLYLVMAGLYFVPSLYLWRYGQLSGAFVQQPNSATLALALAQQKSFWRFVGIMTVVTFIVYVVILFGGILALGMAVRPH